MVGGIWGGRWRNYDSRRRRRINKTHGHDNLRSLTFRTEGSTRYARCSWLMQDTTATQIWTFGASSIQKDATRFRLRLRRWTTMHSPTTPARCPNIKTHRSVIINRDCVVFRLAGYLHIIELTLHTLQAMASRIVVRRQSDQTIQQLKRLRISIAMAVARYDIE